MICRSGQRVRGRPDGFATHEDRAHARGARVVRSAIAAAHGDAGSRVGVADDRSARHAEQPPRLALERDADLLAGRFDAILDAWRERAPRTVILANGNEGILVENRPPRSPGATTITGITVTLIAAMTLPSASLLAQFA